MGGIRKLLSLVLIAVSLMIITTSCSESVPTTTSLSPALLLVTNIIITPVMAKTNETITITAEITNKGGTSGSYLAVLKLNDISKAQTQICVPAQAKEYVSWQISGNPGYYLVSIGEMSTSYTIMPLEDSTAVVPTESLPELRGIPPFTSARAIDQVYYYLHRLAGKNAGYDYWDTLTLCGEFSADFQSILVNQDVNGHKHTGWIVNYKLTRPQFKGKLYYKDYWENLVWLVCKDGYIYEFNPDTIRVKEDICKLNTEWATTYYLFPAPYMLIYSINAEPGDCQTGYIDIVNFKTFREDSKYTFIIQLLEPVVTEKTSYNILIDAYHNSSSSNIQQTADYIVSVDYGKSQFGLLEKDEVDNFVKVRNLLQLEAKGREIKVTVDLSDIALTYPGFQAWTQLYNEGGTALTFDTSPPWWWK